ncbi:MAG: dihydrolipoamide acetyltransferase family protein [Simkaniaceae bacterium]|nr:dihydrolipoamide acetyltransferase family protein [Simkaniaceae bacterium]
MPFVIMMPKLSPTMTEGQIAAWHKGEGDRIEAEELLFEVTTDKATVEYHALDEGFLRKILVSEGKTVRVGGVVAICSESEKEEIGEFVHRIEEERVPPPEPSLPVTPAVDLREEKRKRVPDEPLFPVAPPLHDYSFSFDTEVKGRPLASPLAKKKAEQEGVDIATVKGSGPGGRVMSRDLPSGQKRGITFGRYAPPETVPGSYELLPMTPMRKTVARRLQGSKSFIPHFYLKTEIDASFVMRSYHELKGGGSEITVNDFVMRATALSLRRHPEINSGFDGEKEAIIRFKTVDLALAVGWEGGLITPIVRHADYKDLGRISAEIKYLVRRAKEGKLKTEEYRGGSFTVSNLGMFAIDDFQAVINPPQGAILAVGRVRECPVAEGGHVVLGKRMILSLSSDHRIIDGLAAARFLQTLTYYLEHPTGLLV